MQLLLSEQQVISESPLHAGIIQGVTAQSAFFNFLPFQSSDRIDVPYVRETIGLDKRSLVDSHNTGMYNINKNVQTFEKLTTSLTTVDAHTVGDVDAHPMVESLSSKPNNARAVQVASKSTAIGQEYSMYLINGNKEVGFDTDTVWSAQLDAIMQSALDVTDYSKVNTTAKRNAESHININQRVLGGANYSGTITTGTGANEKLSATGVIAMEAASNLVNGQEGFDGLDKMVAGKYNDLSLNTEMNSRIGDDANKFFDRLQTLTSEVTSKGPNHVDFITMNRRGVNRYKAYCRKIQMPVHMLEEVKMNTKKMIPTYDGIPILENNYVGNTMDGGRLLPNSSQSDTIYLGNFDDGTGTNGICGLNGEKDGGIMIENNITKENEMGKITRLAMFAGLMNNSELALVKGQF